MSELISGKEALITLANGQEVELQAFGDMNWYDSTQWTVGELLCFKGRFRIKPRNITINGIEFPKPFEPKEGDVGYVIDGVGVWRTEAEIKQVITALHKVFKGESS